MGLSGCANQCLQFALSLSDRRCYPIAKMLPWTVSSPKPVQKTHVNKLNICYMCLVEAFETDAQLTEWFGLGWRQARGKQSSAGSQGA